MNEQLVVKNFGPIKDATVDFKRVTVFIGPTGGGKSTLAKLKMMFRGGHAKLEEIGWNTEDFFLKHRLQSFSIPSTTLKWFGNDGVEATINGNFSSRNRIKNKKEEITMSTTEGNSQILGMSPGQEYNLDDFLTNLIERQENPGLQKTISALSEEEAGRLKNKILEEVRTAFLKSITNATKSAITSYIPAERLFIPALGYSWSGLMRDDIGLPKDVLDFANEFSVFRKDVSDLDIPFLNVQYLHRDGQDFIKIPEREEPLMLLEAASGIQSVTPLLVLLEHLSRNTEQAQSFIIEEPELNLYPTAQQGLLNWLVEKCTKGENDLTITTHSPYILSSCNLLLEAYKVAQQRPELADEIDRIVPRACWLNPEEFAAYYVADGTVKPITDDRTHLIGSNELDAVSGDISDSFRQLLRLQKQKPASV